MRRRDLPGPVLFAALIFPFILTGCDLLVNKPEIDMERAMDETIAYANAERLTVSISGPEEWGSSNPPRGTITSIDIRRGFPFEVEFTPSAAHSFLGWRAYRTSVLPANWLDDPDTVLAGVDQLEEGAVSMAAAGENKSAITLAIVDPVTLIPWCRAQPRIIRTDPPLDVQNGYYSLTKTITIYFAAPLDENTAQSFGADYIMIEARTIGTGGQFGPSRNVCGVGDGALSWFKPPVYNNNLRTITIETVDPLPEKEEITVRVGTGIKSALSGNGMIEAVSFSYRTRSTSTSGIASWEASYNPADDTITVTYINSPADTPDNRELRYSVNGGPVISEGIEKLENKFVIKNVPRLDAGGVRNGIPVGNAAGYRIYMDLYTGSEITSMEGPIKIWNFSTPEGLGMRVNSGSPAIEIFDNGNDTDETDGTVSLKHISRDAGKKYVLAENIILTESWTPIGAADSPFQGEFYGSGRTITAESGFSFADAAYTGIFGCTGGNAVICDLTVAYKVSAEAGSSAVKIGGIVGSAEENTIIRNCIVSGANGVSLSKTASADTFLGGMAGYMEPGAVIVNSSASLNVHLASNGADAWAGGVVGRIAEGNTSITNLEGVSVSGDVSLAKTGALRMYIGGVVGASENYGWIKSVSFAGTVSASKDSTPSTVDTATGASLIGGIAGYARRTSFDGCAFTGTVKTPVTGGSFEASGGATNETRIGGIAGHYTTGGYSPTMKNSTASGTFSIIQNGIGTLSLGGVAGLVDAKKSGTSTEPSNMDNSGNKITITNCRYERGNIILERTSLRQNLYDQVGGFAGKIDPCNIENCASLAGLIKATGRTVGYAGSLWVGGFVSEIRQGSNVESCYSTSPVEAYNYSPADPAEPSGSGHRGMMVGGFVALVQMGGAIEKCYASGNVTASAAAQRLAVGGFAGRGDKNSSSTSDNAVLNTITSCYAAGDVRAASDRSSANYTDFDVGGFIGKPEGTTISDCYALGEVFAEARYGAVPVCAGGIAGYLGNDGSVEGAIKNCFAAGSVTAQSAVSGPVYAGGIVGYAASGTVEKNAALGTLILAKSDNSNCKAGRVYGEKNAATPNDNYGLSGMKTGTGGYYEAVIFSPPTSNAAGDDGADVNSDTSPPGIKTQNFWETTLSFSSGYWNFSGIGSRGYPLLK